MARRYRLGARGRIIPLVSEGEVAGAVTVMFSGLGTIVGKGALAGASTITFSPSGTITGKSSLAGAAAIAFTPTVVNFFGKGLVVGASTITFTPTVVNAVGKAVLAEASTITFTATALLGTTKRAGASTITFTASVVNAVGKGALSGASTITFTATGLVNLTVANDDRLPSIDVNTPQFTILGVDLMDNDEGASLSITSVQNDLNCAATLSVGNVLFTADPGFTGLATFEYTLAGDGGNDDALVTVPVGGVSFRRGPIPILRRQFT